MVLRTRKTLLPQVVVDPHGRETYTLTKKIGDGVQGVCYQCTIGKNSQLFAMKRIKTTISKQPSLRRQLRMLSKLEHPNIVHFERAFPSPRAVYILMELCPKGNLFELVNESPLSLPLARRYMIQVCGGLRYLHNQSIVHHDIKPENLFLDAQDNVKIGDFGGAVVTKTQGGQVTSDPFGSHGYMAPELYGKRNYKIDTWALGVLCLEMVRGAIEFTNFDHFLTWPKKLEGLIRRFEQRGGERRAAAAAIRWCLETNPAQRPEMDELVGAKFFTDGEIAGDPNPKDGDPLGHNITYADICLRCRLNPARLHAKKVVPVKANEKVTFIVDRGTHPLEILPRCRAGLSLRDRWLDGMIVGKVDVIPQGTPHQKPKGNAGTGSIKIVWMAYRHPDDRTKYVRAVFSNEKERENRIVGSLANLRRMYATSQAWDQAIEAYNTHTAGTRTTILEL